MKMQVSFRYALYTCARAFGVIYYSIYALPVLPLRPVGTPLVSRSVALELAAIVLLFGFRTAKRGTPLVRTPLSVLTTFPIFYAICMRNQRTIIGNVVEGSVTCWF